MTRPLNEHLLWKGQIQKANYPLPIQRPLMILPTVNTLTGKLTLIPALDIHTKMNKSYAIYSQNYWANVENRKLKYRAEKS